MRKESSYDLNLIRVFDIPQEHHFITIYSNNSVSVIISNDSKYIWKFTRLSVRYLYFLDACLNISLPQRRWFLKCCHVLQGFWIEHAYHSVGASTIQGVVDSVDWATKSSTHFDIHPFRKLSFLRKNVKMAVWCQGVNQRMLAGHTYKNFQLDFREICRKRFKDTFFRPLRLFDFFALRIEIPKLEVRVSSSDEILLVCLKSQAIDCFSEPVWGNSLLFLEVPNKEPPVVGVAQWNQIVHVGAEMQSLYAILVAAQFKSLCVFSAHFIYAPNYYLGLFQRAIACG